jgi:hypothetical protein
MAYYSYHGIQDSLQSGVLHTYSSYVHRVPVNPETEESSITCCLTPMHTVLTRHRQHYTLYMVHYKNDRLLHARISIRKLMKSIDFT